MKKNKAEKGTESKSLSNKQLCEIAEKKKGVIKAKIISPADVVTADWVRLKCQFGCDGFGGCLVCPPFTPTPEQMRKVLDSYKRAILIHFSEVAEIKAMVADIEREIFLLGAGKLWVWVPGRAISVIPALSLMDTAVIRNVPDLQWRPAELTFIPPLTRPAFQSRSSAPTANAQTTTA